MNQTQISLAAKYVRSIRNERKRNYATAWFNFRRGARLEPDRPANLSAMAAQEVEMRIDSLLNPAPDGAIL